MMGQLNCSTQKYKEISLMRPLKRPAVTGCLVLVVLIKDQVKIPLEQLGNFLSIKAGRNEIPGTNITILY